MKSSIKLTTPVRRGLALVLAGEGLGECREASGPREALSIADEERPDVALVDLSPGTGEALRLVGDLCARRIPVVVCSMHEEASCVRRAIAAGARGYVTKREAEPWRIARAEQVEPLHAKAFRMALDLGVPIAMGAPFPPRVSGHSSVSLTALNARVMMFDRRFTHETDGVQVKQIWMNMPQQGLKTYRTRLSCIGDE